MENLNHRAWEIEPRSPGLQVHFESNVQHVSCPQEVPPWRTGAIPGPSQKLVNESYQGKQILLIEVITLMIAN